MFIACAERSSKLKKRDYFEVVSIIGLNVISK